jgi:hypothetical protein
MSEQRHALQVASIAGRSWLMLRGMDIIIGRNWHLTSPRERTIDARGLAQADAEVLIRDFGGAGKILVAGAVEVMDRTAGRPKSRRKGATGN